MSEKERDLSVKIGLKAFIVSAAIIIALIAASGILGMVLPAGSYERKIVEGRTLVVPGSYAQIERPDYSAWRWLTAPVEILFVSGNIALITIILFIVCVGGSIAILEKAGVMESLVRSLVVRFEKRKYFLIAAFIFFFMAVSSFLGVYEGMVPMVVFIVPLAVSLGWDSLTGLGMSLLPLAFGFASAVTNPFTIAVAQKIADLPLFSGSWLRLIFFAAIFALVVFFVTRYARKVEADPRRSLCYADDEKLRERLRAERASADAEQGKASAADERRKQKGLFWFASCVGVAMATVFITARLPGLSDLAFPVMGLLFLVGGVGGGMLAGMDGIALRKAFTQGCANLIPGVILILMAYSVKHVIVSARIMDTILFYAASAITGSSPMAAAFLVYLTTLIMNFFIGSASAKAFLMMPLLAPLADLVGITRQTAVLAFDFGDGFSNMVFPTNALLLIALSFTVVSYPKWMRWTAPLQAAVLVVTSLFLAFAVLIRFGPF